MGRKVDCKNCLWTLCEDENLREKISCSKKQIENHLKEKDLKQVPHVVIETPGSKIKKSYEQIMETGGDDMFDCGIHQFQQTVSRDLSEQFDKMVVNEVRKVGIEIDKPQLERALLDAKSFYDDGYKDAKKEVLEKIYYDIKTEFCNVVGSCKMCNECFDPYFCTIKVALDEVLNLIEDSKGEE